MNKENAKDFLPLVQALIEGKTIQKFYAPNWEDMSDLSLTSPPTAYRIKPEPREWVLYRPAGCCDLIAYSGPVNSYSGGIRVREILD